MANFEGGEIVGGYWSSTHNTSQPQISGIHLRNLNNGDWPRRTRVGHLTSKTAEEILV
jgi:hypothetical protein